MYGVVLCTTKNKKEAQSLAAALVESKLAACVNIVENIRSVYAWEGQICDESEALMIIKTKKELFSDVEKAIKAGHSYDTPEIILLPIEKGSADYLSWINDSTS